MHTTHHKQTAILLLCGIILVLCPGSALAAEITVTANATDTLLDSDGQCSLREAITNINNGGIGTNYADCANSGGDYGSSDTIILPAGTYTSIIGELEILKSLTINGAGVNSSTIDGAARGRVFYIDPDVTAVISNLTIKNGNGSPGGGIYNRGTLTLTNSTVSNNSSYNIGGGGIYNYRGTLTLTRSTVSGNLSTYKGGGIFNHDGTAILIESTVSGNTSNNDSNDSNGGGIFNNGPTFTLTNSTISGNSALQGGGIAHFAGVLTLNNCTVYGNTALIDDHGGGIFMSTCAEHCEIQSAKNTIVANNTGRNCNQGVGFQSHGHNLDSDGTCGFTDSSDLIGDPLLNLLADNGGPTETHALTPGSPALNAVSFGFCTTTLNLAVTTDQRGLSRPQGLKCDIGAYELSSPPIGTPPPNILNLSTRLLVLPGDNVGVGGVIITGIDPKHLVIRAIGPSLIQLGVPNALADPVLELHGPDAFPTITNDNWEDDPAQAAAILATGLAPTNNLESAIDATLNPGAYTAVMRGQNGTSGVALVEIYDLSQEVLAKLANLSTRAFVSTGDNIAIAGFVLGGEKGDGKIALRGIGPSLAAVGVTNALADPTLELRNGNGALLIANNDWQDNPDQATELTAAGLAPTDPLESGIVAMLPPGAYTALLAGHNNGTGVGLVEFYDLNAAGGP